MFIVTTASETTHPLGYGKYREATLPVEVEEGLFLDEKIARRFGEELAADYCFAEPYPHIVLDNFLPKNLAEKILQNFPVEKLETDKFYESPFGGFHKRQVFPESCNGFSRTVFNFLNSSPILQFLEGLTTIDALMGDAYFDGGGFHEIYRGGKLGVHADFRINERLHLNRRINLLIYLNKDWDCSYGGELEIWDRKMTVKADSVYPVFNRCLIFSTDADSYHGHPDPLTTPEGTTRKSLAMYYYTASKRVYDDTPAHSTMYVARPGDSAQIRKKTSSSRRDNYMKDWLPPIMSRNIRALRDMARRKLRRQ